MQWKSQIIDMLHSVLGGRRGRECYKAQKMDQGVLEERDALKNKLLCFPFKASPSIFIIFISLHIRNSCFPSSASLSMAILLKLIILKSFFFLTSAFFSDAQHQLGYKSVIYYYQFRPLQVITHVVQPRYRDSQKCFHHIPAGIS